jgi:hypothetical protein
MLACAVLVAGTPATAAAADLSKFKTFGPAGAAAVDNSRWAAFLGAYVVAGPSGPNLVRYGAVAPADKASLAAYVEGLEAIDPTTLARDEAFAYWVNLYNAITVRLILDNYPVTSIREIKSGLVSFGPWGRTVATVAGVELSLDDIEHKILRAYFGDNRVHYAVNCASIGCPDLRAEPWTGEDLSADLDAAARAYVNSPRGARLDGGRIVVSSIYRWFKEDFGGSDAGVLAHLKEYAAPDLKAQLGAAAKIDGHDYDWRLNEPRP